MKKILSKDKKGILGLNTVKGFMIGILGLAVIAVAVLITLSAIGDTSLATTETDEIEANISNGIVDFFANAPTFFVLLGVVVIILIISIVVIAVNNFGGGVQGSL